MTTPGRAILADRYVNKGTACSVQERRRLGLDGLLPPVVEDLKTQLRRVELEYASKSTDLGRHVFLRALQDRNLVLFYAFLEQHRSANRSALARLGQPAYVGGHACLAVGNIVGAFFVVALLVRTASTAEWATT